jgi:hypothetical protein
LEAVRKPLISLIWARNVLQHGIGGKNEAETRKSLQFQRETMVPVERIELPTFGLQIGGRTLTAANVG